MIFIQTRIPDVILIKPQVFSDNRGFFLETYRDYQYREAGISSTFVQDNHSGSSNGILRGLHYQIKQPQGKLIRVIAGEVFDVAVDLRKNSDTFGQWTGEYLSTENKHQLWIPVGFAHGFFVISEWAEVIYKTTDYYAPEWERTLLWCDPEINIKWPIPEGTQPILSDKDIQGKLIHEADLFN